jgi:hypothetical protein
LTWNPVASATAYEIRVHDISAARTNIFPGIRVTGVQWTPPGDLISGRTYSWQIRAVNALGIGAWTTSSRFVVARPTLSAPIGDGSDRTPEFTWSAIAGVADYEIQVKDLTTGKVVTKQIVADVSWTPTTDLVAGHRYRWWVRALNSSGLGGSSVYKDFRII